MTLAVQVGIPAANAKSFEYGNSAYNQVDPVSASIAAAGSSSVKFTAFTKKQLRQITLVPTVAPTVNDQLTITLTSLAAQTFGTATGGSYGGTQTGAGFANGTNTATGSNTVTIGPLTSFGTSPAFNPHVDLISGGTYTVVVANASGTNTQTNYVFAQGPNGGLTVNPGDIVQIAKGTDTAGVYQIEAELSFTPGSTFTI